MAWKMRPPMLLVALALLGLIALLATLQYRWLGRISEAERDRMKASLSARAAEFAEDFDRELTRAYLLFQMEPMRDDRDSAEHFAVRYDRWLATSRYPRLVKEFYVATGAGGTLSLQRFDPSTRRFVPADWPPAMAEWRTRLMQHQAPPIAGEPLVTRHLIAPVWENVPALVVPSPILIVSARAGFELKHEPRLSYSILVIDREFVASELLPALVRQHFAGAGDGFDFQVLVMRTSDGSVVYRSTPAFIAPADGQADASADLFAVRTQAFGAVASEVKRFTMFVPRPDRSGRIIETQQRISVGDRSSVVMIQQEGIGASLRGGRGEPGAVRADTIARDFLQSVPLGAAAASHSAPRWRLLLKHPEGSLEVAVTRVRHRNLLVSSGVLLLLAASLVMITVSSQRAQRLARQQMEFVAAVSHELRTPLAVIRSAGENLADGVVHDEAAVRKYGDLVRNEGRRLTEMVEQILEFAGIQSGQRGFALRPVAVLPLLQDVVEASSALTTDRRLTVEFDVPADLPPVLGDESALRRVFQNLVGNAIKYGGSAGWLGVQAARTGREVRVTIGDRGIGIAPSEHARIFEPFYRTPDVVGAQIQGAGLGLSLVKRIVEAHGGRITLRSAPGQGSHFTVHLPAAGGERVRATDEAAATRAAGFAPRG